MANFFKHKKRENNNQNSSGDAGMPWYRSNRSYLMFLFGGFVLFSFLLFPRTVDNRFSELKEGSVADEEIIAPFTFLVRKSDNELDDERRLAEQSVLALFSQSEVVMTSALDSLNNIHDKLVSILVSTASDSVKFLQFETFINQKKIILGKADFPFFSLLTEVEIQAGEQSLNVDKLDDYFEQLQKILVDIFIYGIIDIRRQDIPGSNSIIIVGTEQTEVQKLVDLVYELQTAREQKLLDKLRNQFGEESDSVRVGYELIEKLISPNLFYDQAETESRIETARSQVPLSKRRILKGERIIFSNEKVVAAHKEILQSLSAEIAKREAQSGMFSLFILGLGKVLLIILTLIPLIVFLYYQRRRVWDDRRIMFMIMSSMLFILILSAVVLNYNFSKYLIPIAAVPIIITSFQDTRTGFFVGLSMSLLIGVQNGNDFEITLVGLLVTVSAIFALGFSKYRMRLAYSTFFIFLTYLGAITVLGIVRYQSFNEVASAWGFAIAASIFATMIAYNLILLFDAVFDIASEFKLIELSDLNNPVLKMFSIRSPGSYHHSLQVSNISEAAAEAISANALLTKVGAYYHDIGKMYMPEYFVENQKGGKNPHDRLTPRLSSLILINHVRKGYEFARENKIPSIVCKFITEHHGSSLMQFFYEKAKEKAGDETILETDFRYPGTKPQSKETGILMLADSVEATVRSVKEPTLGKIRNVIRNVVDIKISDGELDDCPLTMRDLGFIIDTFSNVLIGIHHGRLEYPGQKNLLKSPLEKMTESKAAK